MRAAVQHYIATVFHCCSGKYAINFCLHSPPGECKYAGRFCRSNSEVPRCTTRIMSLSFLSISLFLSFPLTKSATRRVRACQHEHLHIYSSIVPFIGFDRVLLKCKLYSNSHTLARNSWLSVTLELFLSNVISHHVSRRITVIKYVSILFYYYLYSII